MKKSLVWISFAAMLMTCAAAFAEEEWGGSLGIAYWKPDWDRSASDATTSGIWGPTGSIRYKNFSLTAQYFTGKFDIEFHGLDDTYAANRTDLDIGISYRFLKYLSATVGYKSIAFDWDAGYRLDATIKGIALGLGASYTFPSRFLIYGSGSYLPALKYKWNFGGLEETYDGAGTTLDAGIGYVFQSMNIVMKAGYRHQRFTLNDEDYKDLDETNKGIRAEISYLF
jgi:predicted porin